MYWLVIAGLLLLTQLVAASQFLSIDNVNLAFAIEYFDPLNHQPQPPGYPFFVLLTRIFNFVLGSVELTFLSITVLVCGASLPVLASLGGKVLSEWSGRAAVMLLLVNPVFWEAAASSPLRPFLALFSVLTAYCAWRCWNGERRYALWGAITLGVGSGFRPELLPYLLPLWLISTWSGTRSIKQVLLGMATIAGLILIWLGALIVAVDGVSVLARLMTEYIVAQSHHESPLMGASLRGWLRQVSRIVVWNGTAIVWWIWAVPILLWNRTTSLPPRAILFFVIWIVPGLFFQALIHAAAPGHTLATVPALCLLGGHALSTVARRLTSSSETASIHTRETLFAGALVFNVMVFLNFFPLPAPDRNVDEGPSVKHVVAYAAEVASLGAIRSMDRVAFQTLKEVRQFTPDDRPSILMSSDMPTKEWFLNWRILRYYEPERDIWAIVDQQTPKAAVLVRRFDSLRGVLGDPVSIPVPRGGRILWVLDQSGPFYNELRKTVSTTEGRYVMYTDISEDAVPFSVAGFEFVPESTPPSDLP